jgi:hypothetical protein
MDAMNFSNNAMVGLPREFINSCKAENIVIASVANGIVSVATDIPKQDLTNFLLTIPFAADFAHIKSPIRTGNDLN